MATKTITVSLPDDHAEPAWEVALLFPAQGEWSEDDYLWLTDHTRCLVEFTDGHVEVLPMPTDAHHWAMACSSTLAIPRRMRTMPSVPCVLAWACWRPWGRSMPV